MIQVLGIQRTALLTAADVCAFVLQDRADRATRYAQVQQEAEAARLTALQGKAAEDEAKREATQRERRCLTTSVPLRWGIFVRIDFLHGLTEIRECC